MNRWIVVLMFSLQSVHAQETQEPPKFYKLDYIVKELEGGKVVNSRAYSAVLSSNTRQFSPSSIRTGSRVPYQATPEKTDVYSVGTSIDTRSGSDKQNESMLAISVTADITSVAPDSMTNMKMSIIRHNRWEGSSSVPLGKPTTLFSSEDPSSKRVMQLELTATLLR